MNYYADVILPLPLHGTFTYELTKKEYENLGIGHRVAVSFGKRKVYTGVICLLYTSPSPRDRG